MILSCGRGFSDLQETLFTTLPVTGIFDWPALCMTDRALLPASTSPPRRSSSASAGAASVTLPEGYLNYALICDVAAGKSLTMNADKKRPGEHSVFLIQLAD